MNYSANVDATCKAYIFIDTRIFLADWLIPNHIASRKAHDQVNMSRISA